ncbi:hypothetical protein CEXT_493531 [Caerostris extrusa]|uniref:Uncharacterized protein n=1 Tax=Caerostris extrusa TaxID=172846 RepID=A0AAV4N310_CAEEX|nr:hypothetical protein CEXT_493531 [Caerostris extrusa]
MGAHYPTELRDTVIAQCVPTELKRADTKAVERRKDVVGDLEKVRKFLHHPLLAWCGHASFNFYQLVHIVYG